MRKNRRRLFFNAGTDRFIASQSESRVQSRSAFVESAIERYRSVLLENDVNTLKKFKHHELDVLRQCFSDDPAKWFDQFVAREDLKEFVRCFLVRAKSKSPKYDTTELERVLLDRTTTLEFVLIIEHLINTNCRRIDVFSEELVQWMACCLAEINIIILKKMGSRDDIPAFKRLLLEGGKNNGHYSSSMFDEAERVLEEQINEDQFRCLLINLASRVGLVDEVATG